MVDEINAGTGNENTEENVEAVKKPVPRKPASPRKTGTRSTAAKTGAAPKRRGRPPVQKPVAEPETVNPVDSEPVEAETVIIPSAEPVTVENVEPAVEVSTEPEFLEPASPPEPAPEENSADRVEQLEEKLEEAKDAAALEEADKSNVPHKLSEAALKNRKYIIAGLGAIAVVSLIAIGVVIGLASAQVLAQEVGKQGAGVEKMMVDEDSPYNDSYILDVWKDAYKEGLQDGFNLKNDGYPVMPYEEDYYEVPLEETSPSDR